MIKFIAISAVILFSTASQAAENAPAWGKAYDESMEKMHYGMMVNYSDNADADFVRGMIPHHQGAVDMAKIQLQYGKDPEIRKLAEGIIKAQEVEIKQMQDWLKTHEKPATK